MSMRANRRHGDAPRRGNGHADVLRGGARFRAPRFWRAARRRARNHRRHRRLFVKRRRRPLMTLGSSHSRVRPAERRHRLAAQRTRRGRCVFVEEMRCDGTRGRRADRRARRRVFRASRDVAFVACERRESRRARPRSGRRFTSRRAVRLRIRSPRARSSWTRRLTKTRPAARRAGDAPAHPRSPRARRWRRRFRCSRRIFFRKTTTRAEVETSNERIPRRKDSFRGCGGWTCLHFAARGGYLHLVDALTRLDDVDVAAKDDAGATALHVAAETGVVAVLESLLAAAAERDREPEEPEARLCTKTNVSAPRIRLPTSGCERRRSFSGSPLRPRRSPNAHERRQDGAA